MWDLRSPDCAGLMQCPGRPVVAFDPEGLIFAVGLQSEQIKLYDLRSFDKVINPHPLVVTLSPLLKDKTIIDPEEHTHLCCRSSE